jgi:hypothetical protein
MTLGAEAYFERPYGEPSFLPSHGSYSEMSSGEILEFGRAYSEGHGGEPERGVYLRRDGTQVSGPGSAHIRAKWSFPLGRLDELGRFGSGEFGSSFQ